MRLLLECNLIQGKNDTQNRLPRQDNSLGGLFGRTSVVWSRMKNGPMDDEHITEI